jgi:mono/diheme cytochrome c family protein
MELGSVSTENLNVNRILSIILSFLFVGTYTLAKAESVSREELVSKGHQFAVLVCSACHVVATDQRSPPILSTPGPTFDAIANKPETTEASLRTFLLTTHGTVVNPPGMPNPQLVDYQMNEVIAYILSLRRNN